jgi:myotubularin-related protein 1/2
MPPDDVLAHSLKKTFCLLHPFHTRCGHGEGKNEQGGDEGELSPIFLQFLDCVFQLVIQFPNYFEFSTRYLLLVSEHIYSCRFGTLLCDSEREREVVAGVRQRTYCMWDYLDMQPELVNPNLCLICLRFC